jgi:signal transduction histidine kinase
MLGSRPAESLRGSFRTRLFAGMTAVILAVSTGFAALLFYQQYRSEHEKMSIEGNLTARLLARDVRLAVFAGDHAQVSAAATGVMSLPDVQSLEVLDRSGNQLAHLDRPQVREATYIEFTAVIPGLINRQMEQSLIVGKTWGGDPDAAIGTVRVVMDETRLRNQFKRLVLMALATTLAFLALGILAAFYLARSMTRPLLRLSAGAAALEQGDDSVRVEVATSDEIGQLAIAFNTMVDAIRTRNFELQAALDELSRLNQQLEEMVRKRTSELEAANRELASFNYSASHDLRAPLNRLAGFCEALREEYGDRLDDTGRLYLERIAAVGDQMNRVLSAMLTLYQVQQREMNVRPLDLSEIVQAVNATLRETYQGRQMELVVQEGVMVNGDMKLLWLALENLLGNAWKFTTGRDPGRIEFGMMEREGEQTCFIRDNGAGFDMTYADKLFTPFQRLHNSEDFPGTGVGLAIVQRIMARHGGRIWLDSEEGAGTTCFFVLPPPTGAEPHGAVP